MPAFATLETTVNCRTCDCSIQGEVRFQWGEIPAKYERVGDEIRWARIDGMVLRPFRLFPSHHNSFHNWNFGDPKCEHVVVLDGDFFAPDAGFECPDCSAEIYVALHIVRNKISEIEVLHREGLQTLLGPEIGHAECVTVDPDGKRHVRTDFFNRVVPFQPYGPGIDDLLD